MHQTELGPAFLAAAAPKDIDVSGCWTKDAVSRLVDNGFERSHGDMLVQARAHISDMLSQ